LQIIYSHLTRINRKKISHRLTETKNIKVKEKKGKLGDSVKENSELNSGVRGYIHLNDSIIWHEGKRKDFVIKFLLLIRIYLCKMH
jgi:hypothetical protein